MSNLKIITNFDTPHRKRLKSNYESAHPNYCIRKKEGNCEFNNNKGYNVSFSGSAQKESVTAAKTIMEKLMDSRAFGWLTGFAGAHNVAAAALVALFLAGGLRPAITVSLPGKKDLEDKIYAAGHSMSSGLIGFGFSTLITTPIDSGNKYIYEDAKKISIEAYNQLTKEELAKHIRKCNYTPEDIAKLMKTEELPEEKILKDLEEIIEKLKDTGNRSKSEAIADYVKEHNGKIMPLRELYYTDKKGNVKYLGLKFIANHIDKINELKHQLHLETDMVKKGKLLGEIRDLENWVKGADTTMKNVSEWAIAIPRAMLTIALIPPILKYVFHVEKKNKSTAPEITAKQSETDAKVSIKSLNQFIGGIK